MIKIEEGSGKDFSVLLDVAAEGIELTSAILMLNEEQAKGYAEEWEVSSVGDATKRIASLILDCFHSVLNFANQGI